MGWRYDEKLATQLLKGVWNMHESPTYQASEWRAYEGRRKAARKRRDGSCYGKGPGGSARPTRRIIAAIEAIHDVDRLESLTDRIFDATAGDWNDLLRGS